MPDTPANVLDFLPKEEHAAIRAGRSGYDCTAGIQKAIDGSRRVLIPAGVYLVKQLNLRSGLELYGEGASSELRSFDDSLASEFMLATYVKDGGTSRVADNMRDIHLHDLKLNGRVGEFGYAQYYYLLAVNATSDLIVERMTFFGFRGDGMYVGSGTKSNTERHNERVTVRDCVFDGAVKDNRNGLSIIDCDTLLVENCTFRNIGNAKLSRSVGGIDFEPDHDFSVYRNVVIRRCNFVDIDTVNTAGITFFNGHQKGGNIGNWQVLDCQFRNCYWGIDSSTRPKTVADTPDNLTVRNCHFLNSVRTDLAIKGLSGARVMGCIFERSPPGNGPGGDAIRLGDMASARSRNAVNAVITGNTFIGIRPQMGAIGVLGVSGLVVAGNTFSDIYGTCINFSEDESADSARHIDSVVISGNTIRRTRTIASGRPVPMAFLSTGKKLQISKGDIRLDAQSFEYDNQVDAGVPRVANGAAVEFGGKLRD
jgi:hypothetical protein